MNVTASNNIELHTVNILLAYTKQTATVTLGSSLSVNGQTENVYQTIDGSLCGSGVAEALTQLQATTVAALNTYLANWVYYVKNTLSVADMYAFAFINQNLAEVQSTNAINCLRYYANLQHIFNYAGFPQVPCPQSTSNIFSVSMIVESRPAAPVAKPAADDKKEKKDEKKEAPKDVKKDEKKEAPKDAKKDEKKDAKKEDKKAAAPAPAADKDDEKAQQIYRMDFRVGKVIDVQNHPSEARLYVEKIDIGTDAPIQVVSGLAEWISKEDFTGKLVVVAINVKSGDMKGVESFGRIMVATNAENNKKEIALAPEGAKIGEKVTFPGVDVNAKADNPIAPKNLHRVMKDLHTNDGCVVQYQNLDFTTSAGPVKVASIQNGTVA